MSMKKMTKSDTEQVQK